MALISRVTTLLILILIQSDCSFLLHLLTNSKTRDIRGRVNGYKIHLTDYSDVSLIRKRPFPAKFPDKRNFRNNEISPRHVYNYQLKT